MRRRAGAAAAVGVLLLVAALLALGGGEAAVAECTGASAIDFECQQKRSVRITDGAGAAAALRDLAKHTRSSGFVRAACHQLTHRIGRTAGAEDGIGAFAPGDPLCGSGYYHGVTEAVMTKLGAPAALRGAPSVCAPLRARRRYSPDVTNCVHGMGHGFMDVLDRRIGASLKGCDGLHQSWERRDCYSGVFMENHASQGDRRALRPDKPLYPCTAVGRRYKAACYERQSTYALFVRNGDFAGVFELCAKAERDFRGACARGLGGDVAAETKQVGGPRATARARRRICMLGDGSSARSACVAGAVGVILQDLDGGPAELDAFCAAFEASATQPQHAVCLRASERGYGELLARQTGQAPGRLAAGTGLQDFVCHLKRPGARRRAT